MPNFPTLISERTAEVSQDYWGMILVNKVSARIIWCGPRLLKHSERHPSSTILASQRRITWKVKWILEKQLKSIALMNISKSKIGWLLNSEVNVSSLTRPGWMGLSSSIVLESGHPLIWDAIKLTDMHGVVAEESMTNFFFTSTQKYKLWDNYFYLCHVRFTVE